jgi:diguanylate cyclase
MKHSDDVSKAVDLLKKTLPEMNKRNIATTPNNYAIWYEFIIGDNPELTAAIKELDTKKATYTTEILQSLYEKYIADAHEAAVNNLSNSVKEIIHNFLNKANKEGQGLTDYAQTLSAFSEKMQNVNDIEDIKGLITHLLDETKKRESATQSMQTTLETMALEMKKLRAEVSKLNSEATTDSLTKVNNRRAFDMEIENFISSSKADKKPLCLLLIDLDDFKRFNDKFGHTIGDKVLRFVATLLKNNIKGCDSVSRFSGEQFSILLAETAYEGAFIVAENIRERLSKQTLSDSAEKIELGNVTASIGVAPYAYGESAEQLIRKADKFMHEAKRAGKNKVMGSANDKEEGNNSSSSTLI